MDPYTRRPEFYLMMPMTFGPLTPATAGVAEALPIHWPWWSLLPFAAMLLSIAVLPLCAPHWWESNRNRGFVALACGGPVAVAMAVMDAHTLQHTASEYVAFILLLASLYIITGGIVVRGHPRGAPAVNSIILLLGAATASVIGTTGASMLLVRPLLRANRNRQRKAHIMVFFIFLVSNIGGLLTPLGDPPLFLGFLRGVPFFWTLRLWPAWAFACGFLTLVFYVLDRWMVTREPTIAADQEEGPGGKLRIAGAHNFLFLGAIVAIIVASGNMALPPGAVEAAMIAVVVAAWACTPAQLRAENAFSWTPIVEVMIVFAGIFAAMMPALALLNVHGSNLGLREPWQFFWVTGLLSSFLDNAPTYLTFTTCASALLGTDAQQLQSMLLQPGGPALLSAISVGAVMMGANTYLGNGPNFMVRAIAEDHGVRMPNFFAYMGYSAVFLLPLFGGGHVPVSAVAATGGNKGPWAGTQGCVL